MKIKAMALPKAGTASIQEITFKDGDVLNLRHKG